MPDDAGYNEHHFEFDLDRGIRAQVVEKLQASPLLPLAKVSDRRRAVFTLCTSKIIRIPST